MLVRMGRAVDISLSDQERREVQARAGKLTLAYRDVQRAKIVLYAAGAARSRPQRERGPRAPLSRETPQAGSMASPADGRRVLSAATRRRRPSRSARSSARPSASSTCSGRAGCRPRWPASSQYTGG